MNAVIDRLAVWLAPPTFIDDNKTRQAALLNVLLLAVVGGALLVMVAIPLFAPLQLGRLPLLFAFIPLMLLCRLLINRGYVTLASAGFILIMWLMFALFSVTAGGVTAPSFSGYIIIVLLTSLLIGYRAALAVAVLSSATGFILAVTADTLMSSLQVSTPTPLSTWLAHTGLYFLAVAAAYLATNRINEALQRAQRELKQRQRVENALRSSEEKYRNLVEDARDVVFTLAPDGTFTSLNPAFERITGWPREAWIHQPFDDLLTAEQARDARLSLHRLLTEAAPVLPTEVRLRHRSGRQLTLEVSATVQKEEDVITGVLGIGRDVTRRKQAEQVLRQAQRLDSLGMLAGGIAHDFNNLLSIVLGQTEQALALLDANDPARPATEKAAGAAERAAELTRELLVYSGRSDLEVEPVDLNQLITGNRRLLQMALPENVTLHLELAPELPAIAADRSQIQQVLLNLVLNGAQATTGRAGTVTVSTRLEHLNHGDARYGQRTGQTLTPGNYACLQVRDDGHGMDAATLSHIFEPFFTTKPSGSGLGLAAVLGIVRRHDGGIDVQSKIGQGTAFVLLFPPSSADVTAVASAQDAVLESKGTVLVVDDDPRILEVATRALQQVGVSVATATTGEEGLALLQQPSANVQLVLLDLSMPGAGGPGTLQALRAHYPTLPVILTSGYPREEALLHVNSGDVADFLQKPYRLSTLVEKVQKMLALANPAADVTAAAAASHRE